MQSLQQLQGINLKWAVDPNEELAKQSADRMFCNYSTSFEEALEDKDVNAVIVASPTGVHFE